MSYIPLSSLSTDLSTIDGKVDVIDGIVDTITTDVTTVDGKVDTIDSNVDTIVTDVTTVDGKVSKIDGAAVLGLSGTEDSLAYKIEEIEEHFHSSEKWYGKDGGTGYLLAEGLTSFVVTAGTGEAWGTELQISNGAEIESGSSTKKVDFHRALFTNASANDKTYLIEFRYGTGLVADSTLLTQLSYRKSTASADVLPVIVHSPRITCNNKLWVRCKSQTDSATISFILGTHTYSN